jgi:aminoglycoside/choline kinase family phosphotransferase
MVRARAGIEPGTGVREELAALAGRAARVRPRLFMHRDFQSRNIVLGPGDRPRFIDFQSGRIGPAAYDLASLLEDPYVAMPDGLKEELFTLYLDTLAGICDIEKPRFRREYPLLAAQRLMQALGAFARLSRLGKEGFAAHIPAALAGLARALAACGAFPALAGLVEEIIQSQGQR